MNKKELSLIYVWDPYCGWCYGFSKSLQSFCENHPELPITILSGGLFVADRKMPMSSFSYIPEVNQRISQLTGVEFGKAYQNLIEEGTFTMDSEAAAKGFSALRYFAPERPYQLAASMQQAFYQEGKSLSDPATYKEIALAHNMDPEAVVARFLSNDSTEDAQADFTKVQQLGIQSYPTLLLKKDDEYFALGGGVMTPEKLEVRLQSIIS